MRFETQNIFFASDYHLGHHNVIKYDNRPFKNVDEMHGVLLKNWNETVGQDDIVFYLMVSKLTSLTSILSQVYTI